MPVTSSATSVSYTANGATTVFAYGFKIAVASHLKVYFNGALQSSAGYTVSGAGDDTGGSVTFSVAPSNGVVVLLRRESGRTRSTDYVNNGDFFADTVDADQDLQTMQLQELGEASDRSLRAPFGETVADLPAEATRAGKVLGFDSNGDPTVLAVSSSEDTSLRSDLASQASASLGATLVGFLAGGNLTTGTVRDKLISLSTDKLSIGKTTIPISSAAFTATATNQPQAATVTVGNVVFPTLDFDQTATERAQVFIYMPKSWDKATITYRPIWMASAGTAAQGVKWSGRALTLADQEDISSQSFGTPVAVVDTLTATNRWQIGAESAAITIAGPPAENEVVVFEIARDPADAADTLAADARLCAVALFITISGVNDA